MESTVKLPRTLVIGDIHGAYNEMIQALERADYNPHEDRLIFLGDLFDRHRGTVKIIEYLCYLDVVGADFILIIGNHDLWVFDWITKDTIEPLWLKNGGELTLKDLRNYDDTPENKLEHFHNIITNCTKYYYVDDDNNAYVHGGFTGDSLGQEWQDSVYAWDRSLWKKSLHYKAGNELNIAMKPKFMESYNKIFIGHNPVLNVGQSTPMMCGNVVNMDTGAGYFGVVSVLDVNTMEFWQSDPVNSKANEPKKS